MRRRSRRPLLALLAALALAGPGTTSASAAPVVSNTADSGPGSLRQAIVEAGPGETIAVPPGTYTLTSAPLAIEKSLTIVGQAPSETTVRSGGAFRVFEVEGAGASVTLSGLTIRDGSVVSPSGVALGGGIHSVNADLTLRGVVLTANRAVTDGAPGGMGGVGLGGGIAVQGGRVTIVDSTVSGNLASAVGGSGKQGGVALGGGVAVNPGMLVMERTTVSGNLADARGGQGPLNAGQNAGVAAGGGVAASEEASPVGSSISSSTFNQNLADATPGPGGTVGVADGGGVFQGGSEAPLAIDRVTVTGNAARVGGIVTAIGIGGGMSLTPEEPFTTTLIGSTVSANAAEGGPLPGGAGADLFTSTGVRVGDTIVSGGIGPPGQENCNQEHRPQSLGFNIDSTDQCGFHAAGDLVNTNPLLGPLQDNGGPTATMAIPPNSPAVDKGGAFGLNADQRGVLRPIDFPAIPNATAPGADGSDIGAFELAPSSQVTLGGLKRNVHKGTATLTVEVPLPAVGTLTLSGKGLKTQTARVDGSTGVFKLKVLPQGRVRKALRKRGRRKVGIAVTYAPTGNAATTVRRKAKLIKKKRRHRRHRSR